MWLYGCHVPPPLPTIINSKFHSPVNWNAAFASFGRWEDKCFALNCTAGDVREIQFRIQLGDLFVAAFRFWWWNKTKISLNGAWSMQFVFGKYLRECNIWFESTSIGKQIGGIRFEHVVSDWNVHWLTELLSAFVDDKIENQINSQILWRRNFGCLPCQHELSANSASSIFLTHRQAKWWQIFVDAVPFEYIKVSVE